MASRIELHEKLVSLLGSRNVYFQPPESIKLKYPCIIYSLANFNIKKADDKTYALRERYDVMYIDKNPDNTFKRQFLEEFTLSSFSRFFISDNLNHYSFSLFY